MQENAMKTTLSEIDHKTLSNAIRFLSIDAVEAANSGHPGMPMGMADVATVLFKDFLRFNPGYPDWPNRDRFVLSNGHGSMLLYALLYLTGYDVTLDQVKKFRQLGNPLAGHPEYGHAPGIETTTGPLGQGFANAVGMALAERHKNASNPDINHFTYVMLGDGCLMEGISHEAASFAGHMKLNKLIALFDDNSISIDGGTDLSTSDDNLMRFTSYGWEVKRIDGHDPAAIHQAISQAQRHDKPTLIACKTTIGYGSPAKAGTSGSHGAALGADEVTATRENLDWPHPPFHIPEDVLEAWRNIGQQNDHAKPKAVSAATLPDFDILRKQAIEAGKVQATRQSSGDVLDAISKHTSGLIGGSADLTGSNNTKAKSQTALTADNYGGNYIYYGVREHGMAAIMNGLTLSGLRPYAGTFLCFSDYCKPSIRLSALMKQPVIYVFTHDSIGLGEDGPTHQPVEHLLALRAIPGLQVLRPAESVETVEAWEIALKTTDKPTALILTRQKTPALRVTQTKENLSNRGAYILKDNSNPKAIIIATGSELGIAHEIAEKHEGVRVISMPSWELFEAQPEDYKKEILPESAKIFSIEAGTTMGWERYTKNADHCFGLNEFGASGKAADLYRHYGLTADQIWSKIEKLL